MATNKLDKNTLTGIANGGSRSRFETDPYKIGDTSTPWGGLSAIGRAAAGTVGNAVMGAVDAFNNVKYPTAGEFADANVRRYQSPTSVTPLPSAPMAAPSVRASGRSTVAPAPTLGMATTPSGYPRPYEQPQTPTSVPVVPGARRVATRPTSSGPGVRPAPAQAPAAAPAVTDPGPMVYENTDAAGVIPAAFQASLPATPGRSMYGEDGTNGGYGFTTNPDGTVERMFTLRQRTAEEDKAFPRIEGMAGGAPEAQARLRPGDVGFAGSQDEWEWNRQFENMGPMSAKDAQDVRLRRLQTEDTYQDNLAKNETTAFGARSLAGRYGVLNQKDQTLLPVEVAAGVAGVRNTEAKTKETQADIALKQLQTEFYPELTRAQIEKLRTEGVASLMNATAATKAAEQKTAVKPEDTVAALLDQTYNKGAKEFTDLLTASPLMAAQYKTAEELQAATHSYALKRVTRLAQLFDQSGVQ